MKVNTAHPVYVMVFAVVFSGVFTAAVVLLQVSASARIERNETLRDQRALVRVFRLSTDVDALSADAVARIVDARVKADLVVTDPASGKQFTVYRAFDDNGKLKAYGFEIAGTGFWAPIQGILSVNPERTRTLRAVFTEQKETPGLGGRITEETFQNDQFDGLDITPPGAGRPWVRLVRQRTATEHRGIEAITGATQTSRAVTRFVNDDVARFQRAMDAWEKK